MVYKCYYCGGKINNKEKCSYYSFPLHSPPLLEKWLENMNFGYVKLTKHSKLCNKHFTDCCFESHGKRKLKPNSVPTIFKQYKFHCAYCPHDYEKNNRTFHRFPIQKPDVLEKWVSNIPIQNFSPTEQSMLCSIHFKDDCFRIDKSKNYKRLKVDAVPTIFIKNTGDCKPSHRITEHTSVQSAEQPENDTTKLPALTDIKLNHVDHAYSKEVTVNSNIVEQLKLKLQNKSKELKTHKKKIKRLRYRISNLKDTVKSLQKQKSIPERSLFNSELIADSDVSQLLTRFQQNVCEDICGQFFDLMQFFEVESAHQ